MAKAFPGGVCFIGLPLAMMYVYDFVLFFCMLIF